MIRLGGEKVMKLSQKKLPVEKCALTTSERVKYVHWTLPLDLIDLKTRISSQGRFSPGYRDKVPEVKQSRYRLCSGNISGISDT